MTPPLGGTATSTVTDARGRTVEMRHYKGGVPTGDYDSTTYGYNRRNLLERVTDVAGNRWEYGYDGRGRQIRFDDPDKGRTTSEYDDAGRLTATTDARGTKLAYTYDDLGRKTGVYRDSPTGARLAGWTYDTTPLPGGVKAKGRLSSSTRYLGSDAYTVSTTGYTEDYKPTDTSVTIPLAEGPLAGTYQFGTRYNPDGSPDQTFGPNQDGVSQMPPGLAAVTGVALQRNGQTRFGERSNKRFLTIDERRDLSAEVRADDLD